MHGIEVVIRTQVSGIKCFSSLRVERRSKPVLYRSVYNPGALLFD